MTKCICDAEAERKTVDKHGEISCEINIYSIILVTNDCLHQKKITPADTVMTYLPVLLYLTVIIY